MNLYIWRHSTAFSSWSVMEELKICNENYTRAEVCVLANTEKEALDLLDKEGKWRVEDLKEIIPEVIALVQPGIVSQLIQ